LRLSPSKRNPVTKKVEFLGGDVAIKMTLRNGTFSGNWSDEGINSAIDSRGTPIVFNVDVTIIGKVYTAAATAIYAGKAGKSGRAKF
jgi:hypothetical protein